MLLLLAIEILISNQQVSYYVLGKNKQRLKYNQYILHTVWRMSYKVAGSKWVFYNAAKYGI